MNAHLKIASYRVALSYKERQDAGCIEIATPYAHRGHIERIFNCSDLYELFARLYPRCGMRDRKFYAFRWRGDTGASHNLHIGCLSGTCEKVQTMGRACSLLFAHTLTLFRTRIAYVPETTYIRSHDSGGDPRIDTNARNIIHTGCALKVWGNHIL